MLIQFTRVLAIGCVGLWLIGCSNSSKQADSNIRNSFTSEQPVPYRGDDDSVHPAIEHGPLAADLAWVAIKKDALEKEFLLQASLMVQLDIPMSHGMKSRIVVFKQRANQLVMVESNEGEQISNDLPMNQILAVFPIVAEVADRLIFDFNAGMSHIFVSADWYSSDGEGETYAPQFEAVDTKSSFIDSVSFSDHNELVIRQFSQIVGPEKISAETRYYLSPYASNLNFTPMNSPGFDRMGFFEVHPLMSPGGLSKVLVSRWDLSKPIVFGISANTPREYRNAIRDGILYWNKAFGKEILRVEDAPEGVTAPDVNYNLVQWINWDDAGYAYADAQMDPRTGEIKHAQIFLTSAFAAVGKKRASVLLNRLQSQTTMPTSLKELNQTAVAPRKILAVKNFFQPRMCFLDATLQLENMKVDFESRHLSDDQVSKVVEDYIREVVAHEVGHTLGLRHNFAGSLSQNYSMKERNDLYTRYLTTSNADPDFHTSSSVMDYQTFQESTITGDQIARAFRVLNYDQAAMDVLYYQKTFDPHSLPLFCTDTSVETFVDCQRSDAGYSPFEYQPSVLSDNYQRLPYFLAELIIASFSETPPKNLNELHVDPAAIAKTLIAPLYNLMIALDLNSVQYLRVARSRDYSSIEDYLAGEVSFITNEFERLGGVDTIFAPQVQSFATGVVSKVKGLLQNLSFVRNASGQEGFQLSDLEIDQATYWTTNVMQMIEAISVGQEILVTDAVGKSAIVNGASDLLLARLKKYLLSVSSLAQFQGTVKVKRTSGWSKTVTIKIPVMPYSATLRMVALQTYLTTERGRAKSFNSELKAALEKMVMDAFGGLSFDNIQVDSLPDSARQWLQEQSALIFALAQ